MHNRSLFLILILSFISMTARAQDYSTQWKKIAALEQKGLTKDALKETVSIFNDAVAKGNEAQQIKAAMYQMKYRNMVQEENQQQNIFYVDTLIAKTKAPAKNILQSMQAELFLVFKENNRYKLYNRTALTEEHGNDIDTWSLAKLNDRITALYKASLSNETLLKETSLKPYAAVLDKQVNTENLRPTLYDLLAHRALDYFMNSENDVPDPTYKFIINDETAFAPVTAFINHHFISKDSASLNYNALLILQDLLRFHAKDAQPDALLDADLDRLSFINDHGVFTDKEKLYETSLENIETNYGSNPASARASYLRAVLHKTRGDQYHPYSAEADRLELVKALQICEAAYSKFPKSEGGINCKNLAAQIKTPALHFATEKVDIPGQPFRALVKYKNTGKVYFRVVKTSREELAKLSELNDDEKDWAAVVKLTPVKAWDISMPDLQDHQEHAAEVKVDALPAGVYYLIMSRNADFSRKNNIVSRAIFFVSNISYIYNNRQELYVLNRDNGTALDHATVQLWANRYNENTRKYELQKGGNYTSDKNGLVHIPSTKNYENKLVQVKYGNDELFTYDNYNDYYYSYYEGNKKTIRQTFLFTDRSIYRPGQTIFFKGIMTETDSSGRKSRILPGTKSRILLLDQNNQRQSGFDVLTNEYGSYSGSFILPEGLLNGNFHLQDSLTASIAYFSVEEYKRPTFSAELKAPEGSYRVNDSIHVTGFAKAYAGNNTDGAKVSYHVVRVVRWPVWYGFYRYPTPANAEQEITSGTTITDGKGMFAISFKAIPDETADKKDEPVFDYRVTADITDPNGETRSASEIVSVSYQALHLDIIADDKLPADSIKNIGISSSNANGLFEKAMVNFTLYKVTEPAKIFRTRFWDAPDQFTMSKEEYYANFPYDAYSNEDQMSQWPLGQKLIDIIDTTSPNSKFNIRNSSLGSGWYKIIVTTKDKYGEDVRAEKFVQLTGPGNERINEAIRVTKNKINAEPGEHIRYDIATGFDNIWLIQTLQRSADHSTTSYPKISTDAPISNGLDVTENDRGGIRLDYAFVKHNRMYNGSEGFDIPWSNKDLNISYETFRDKLEPGSQEKWKIKITGAKAEQLSAEALISMYDASLDAFKPHSWNSLSSLWPGLSSYTNWTGPTFNDIGSVENETLPNDQIAEPEKIYPALADYGWNEGAMIRYKGMYEEKDMLFAANAAPMTTAVDGSVSETQKTHMKLAKPVTGQTRSGLKDDESMDTTVTAEAPHGADNISIRKNFNETAFFFPQLNTDAAGNIEFSFTIPEALTQWKMMVLAHTKDLASAFSSKTTVTQKKLMVQPNAPRFLREGDRMEFSAKVSNLTDKEMTGSSTLELMDAATNKPIDGWFKNMFPLQYFTVPAGQSITVKFPIDIPFNFNSAMTFRIKAISKDGAFSDGEEEAIPVLTNRTLVTETMPLNMRNTNSKTFRFDKLLNSSNSGSLTHHALTVEYTSNPAWYAVQALPYLMEYPYECAEQSFNRYYANTLASNIANSNPAIRLVFEKWALAPSLKERAGGEVDTAALMSNLQKNEELKSVLLQETPWVLDAQDETQQKKNIALLFDMVRLANEKNKTLAKLRELQTGNGGFAWFKGGEDDQYITQYIITGIGHLRKLNAVQGDYNDLKPIVDKALPYLDARIKDEYDELVKYKADLSKDHLSYDAIEYLYMRSFFRETAVSGNAKKAVDYFKGQAKKYWLNENKYMQAMIALALYRDGDNQTPKAIIESLKQNSINSEEMGMYWKDMAAGGYYWYQAPIESQAMMIEAFTDIDKNVATVNDLKTWLLKQKQTQQWPTTKATAEACYALLLTGSDWLSEEKTVTISLGNTIIKSADEKTEAGTGYFKKSIDGDHVQQGMGNITVSVQPANRNPQPATTTWGAVYWQYFEDLDKITSAATPLKLVKKLYIEINSDKGTVLKPVNDGDELKVGDKIKVRIELRADRDMEYVHMKDMRAACMEPVNVLSEYKYQGGLGYYESTKDASTNFFFGWLPKGTYVFEYPMFVTHTGNFSNGITTIQCMYAPEFTSHSEGVRVQVGE